MKEEDFNGRFKGSGEATVYYVDYVFTDEGVYQEINNDIPLASYKIQDGCVYVKQPRSGYRCILPLSRVIIIITP